MKSLISTINPEKETGKITSFISSVLKKTGFKKVVIGLSGGIDSTISLFLLRKALEPENIFIAHLYFFQPKVDLIKKICSNLLIPTKNQYIFSIKNPVDSINNLTQKSNLSDHGRVRIGNIMARVRMVIIYDLAKQLNALVCGTENKSEHLLGYFTRFGDAASDLEPITHLYKTQVYELAKYLKVPEEIIKAKPTAGLWKGQTDEGQFGFTYKDADYILYLYFDKKLTTQQIAKKGFKNSEKIINFANKNQFKKLVPYSLLNYKHF